MNEISRLTELESRIEAGLNTFIDVGNALLEIRDEKLYRLDYGTFEEYCQERWGFNDRRARQLISAAETVATLKSGTVVPLLIPTTERIVRPLTKLEPEEQPIVWRRAVESAPNGKVTAAHVQTVVDSYKNSYPLEHYNIEDEYGSAETFFSSALPSRDEDALDDDSIKDECGTVETIIVPKPHVSHNSGNWEGGLLMVSLSTYLLEAVRSIYLITDGHFCLSGVITTNVLTYKLLM